MRVKGIEKRRVREIPYPSFFNVLIRDTSSQLGQNLKDRKSVV